MSAATVFVGFSRTFYLKKLFAAPSLPVLFHIHGALFTAWVLMFIAQALLVARTMLPPALGRAISLTGITHPALFFGAAILFIAAIGIHDGRTLGRVHPVTLWGGLLLVLSFPGRLAIANTDLWLTFAGWLTR